MRCQGKVVKLAPERTTGWIDRSFALHEMKHTQEAYETLKPGLDAFKQEQLGLVQYGVLPRLLAKLHGGLEANTNSGHHQPNQPHWLAHLLPLAGRSNLQKI